MQRLAVSNRTFFYTCAFATDCFNYVAILAEAFFAARVLAATPFEMGLLGASSALGYTVTCVWSGALSERLGRRPLGVAATAGQLLAYLITPYATSMAMLCGISLFRSLATSFYWTPLMAWMTETCSRQALPRVLGGYNAVWSLGIMVGYYISGWLFEHVGPAAPFHFAAVFAAATLLWIAGCTPRRLELQAHDHDMAAGDVRAFVRQGLLLNCLGYALAALVLYMYPKVMFDRLGEEAQSLLHVMRVGGSTAAFLAMTWSAAWHFKRWPVWSCLALYGASLICIGLSESYAIQAVGFALLGIGCGQGYMLCSYYVLALVKSKGLGVGFQESLIGGGNLIGPLYGGLVATYTSPRASILAGLAPLGVVLVAVVVARPRADHGATD